jgi:hypothetical protein
MKKVIAFSLLIVFITISCCKEDPIMIDPIVGEPYQGGIVAKIFEPGDQGYIQGEIHGLISSSENFTISGENTFIWGTVGLLTEATSIYDGKTNTNKILAIETSTDNYAAKICHEYSGGGYNDWFLPSSTEMGELILGLGLPGQFWTSTELLHNRATVIPTPFDEANTYKDKKYYVRAVRRF